MSQQTITEAQKTTVEETVKALTDALHIAAEQVDFDGASAIYSDAYDVGFIGNGAFYPSLVSAVRDGFARLQSQEIEVSDTRVAVLASNVAVLTAHGNGTALLKDGNRWAGPWAGTFVYAKVGDDWKCVHVHHSLPNEA